MPRSSWLPPELASEPAEPPPAPKAPAWVAPPFAEPEPIPTPAGSVTHARRTRAVDAYCRELFAPAEATTFAEQIISSHARGVSDDILLLHATRTAAAEELADGRSEGTSRECAATPTRLADRANGTLTRETESQLEQHLASCLVCRAAELRSIRADRAFAAILALKPTTTD